MDIRPAIHCPSCGREVSGKQNWCLQCGAAARTRLAPTPPWKTPIAITLIFIFLSGTALTYGFIRYTSDNHPRTDSPLEIRGKIEKKRVELVEREQQQRPASPPPQAGQPTATQ